MSPIELTLLSLIVQGIPEQIALITLACAIAKAPFKWRDMVILAAIMGSMAKIIRSLPLPFGVHTIVLLLLLFLFLNYWNKIDVSLALIGTIGGFVALMIYEVVSITIITELIQIPRETWYTNELLKIAFGYPHIILLFLTAFIVRRRRGMA